MSEARFIDWANNTREFSTALLGPTDSHVATMDAFTIFLSTIVTANATAYFSTPVVPGDVWTPDSSSFNEYVAEWTDWEQGSDDLVFKDPLPDVRAKMNELMFREALLSAGKSPNNITSSLDSGLSTNQSIHAKQQKEATVYETDYRWFAAAAVLDVLTILVVLPLFWGFSRLPRHLNQSLFEMALAFNSPLVSSVRSGKGAKGVASELGKLRVSYGLVNSNINSHVPASGFTGATDSPAFQRLGIAESTRVTVPWKGARYTA